MKNHRVSLISLPGKPSQCKIQVDHTTWSDVTQTIPYLYNRLNATYSKTYVCHMFLFSILI